MLRAHGFECILLPKGAQVKDFLWAALRGNWNFSHDLEMENIMRRPQLLL